MHISKPIVQSFLWGYRFIWCEGAEQALAIEVRNIQESHGNMYGEFSIEYFFGEGFFISGIRINLLTKRGRDDIAKRMADLKVADRLEQVELVPIYNWHEIIEQVCAEVITRQRIGDPGQIIVADENDMATPEYYLYPFILKGVPSVIYGDKGSHKTTIALLLAAILYLPWTDNPLGFITYSQPTRIAYLDWEANSDLIKYSMNRLLRGLNIPYFELDYRTCRLPLVDDIERIDNFLANGKNEVIIIDSLGAACGGDLLKAEPALNFFQALKGLKKTSLIIAQNAKNEENKKTIFGSAYFQYYSRNIFEIKHADGINEDEASVALFHRDANYSGHTKPIGFKLTFTSTSICIEKEDIDYGEFSERINRQQQVLDLLKEGAQSASIIGEKLEISEGNVRVILKRLKDKRKVIRLNSGLWGLPLL